MHVERPLNGGVSVRRKSHIILYNSRLCIRRWALPIPMTLSTRLTKRGSSPYYTYIYALNLGVEYEFEDYRCRFECLAFSPVCHLLHRTWVTKQSDPLDLSDTLVGRPPCEPLVHTKDFID